MCGLFTSAAVGGALTALAPIASATLALGVFLVALAGTFALGFLLIATPTTLAAVTI